MYVWGCCVYDFVGCECADVVANCGGVCLLYLLFDVYCVVCSCFIEYAVFLWSGRFVRCDEFVEWVC